MVQILFVLTGFSCDYQDDFGWKPELKKIIQKETLQRGR